jgi:hypothetical protein
MATIHPGVTGRAVGEHLEPLAVSPRETRQLLSIGNTRLYELLNAGELESYQEGRSRRITMRSIRARIERLLGAAGATGAAAAIATHPRRRGRPRKVPASAARP